MLFFKYHEIQLGRERAGFATCFSDARYLHMFWLGGMWGQSGGARSPSRRRDGGGPIRHHPIHPIDVGHRGRRSPRRLWRRLPRNWKILRAEHTYWGCYCILKRASRESRWQIVQGPNLMGGHVEGPLWQHTGRRLVESLLVSRREYNCLP